MDPDRWRQIEQLYHAALERESGTRSAFLAQACNGDQALYQEVESLLTTEDKAGTVFDTQHGSFRRLPSSCSPAQLGPYRIESLADTGGMSTVYRAIDTR